jgi:hypothetical protein
MGPVSVAKSPDSTGKDVALPFIRGPLVDYSYVVDEESFPTVTRSPRRENTVSGYGLFSKVL